MKCQASNRTTKTSTYKLRTQKRGSRKDSKAYPAIKASKGTMGTWLKSVILTGMISASWLATSSAESYAAPVQGTASWYSTETCKINPNPGCPTASGKSLYQLKKQGVKYAASWGLPFGTKVKVVNLGNGKSTIVTILDRGPAKRLNRIIDLSPLAFQEIGALEKGVIKVSVEVLS